MTIMTVVILDNKDFIVTVVSIGKKETKKAVDVEPCKKYWGHYFVEVAYCKDA